MVTRVIDEAVHGVITLSLTDYLAHRSLHCVFAHVTSDNRLRNLRKSLGTLIS